MPTGIGGEKLWLCPSLNDSANDLSGNSNNGTYNGGMGTVADTSNGGTRAYSFDGVDDYINCGSSISTPAPLSVSCWFNSDQLSSFKGLVTRTQPPGYPNFIFYVHNNGELATYIAGHRLTSSVISASTWYHACFTLDSNGNLNLYLNGTVVRADTSVSMNYYSAFDLLVGVYQGGSGIANFFDGLIDDIRIFDRALIDTEITHLATSRGIEGSPYTYSGLGGEKLWLCPSLDDSSDDISGNGNHGTYNGGMGTVADTSNGGTRAYSFDGSDDYINCGNAFNPAASFSISYWINFDTFGTRMIISKNWNNTSEPYISRLDSNGTFRFYTYSGATNTLYGTTVSNPFTTGSWACVTKVYNGSTWAIYFNGSKVAETAQTQAAINNTADLYIGDTVVSGWNFDGLMDDIRFFDRALSTSEITSLASKRGYEVPAVSSGSTPHPLSAPIFHPLG